MLTAATVTTGQLVALEKSQQAYYSVSSAAELLRDSIQGGTCTMPDPADSATWTCTLPAQSKNGKGQEALQKWLNEMVQKASSAGASATATFEVSLLRGTESARENVIVSVTATMKADFSLHFSLRPKIYTEPVGDYRITLDIPAALLHGADGTTVERITWERAIIGKPLEAE